MLYLYSGGDAVIQRSIKKLFLFILLSVLFLQPTFWLQTKHLPEKATARRVLDPESIVDHDVENIDPESTPQTSNWELFLHRIVLEAIDTIIPTDDIPNIEPSISNEIFNHLRYRQPISSCPKAREMITHLWFRLGWGDIQGEDIHNILSEIDNMISNYDLLDFSSLEDGNFITYIIKPQQKSDYEIIDSIDLAREKELLELQREFPYEREAYLMLRDFYEEMVEKYPQRFYYYWQTSWVLGALDAPVQREIYFKEGINREFEPLPTNDMSVISISKALLQYRTNSIISWGNYASDQYANYPLAVYDHALKYCLQFPEFFKQEDSPLAVSSRDFNVAVTHYNARAREIIRDEHTKIYAFCRNNQLKFAAVVPDTGEIVGFRVNPYPSINGDSDGNFNIEIAIDTFYKISPVMLNSFTEHPSLTLLSHVPYDAYSDAFWNVRETEARAEERFFGLNDEMYQEALSLIDKEIIPQSDKISVILMAGLSSAGKSPGVGRILDHLSDANINIVGGHNFIAPSTNRNVVVMPMDFYFIDRIHMPMKNGKKDFDNPRALDFQRFRDDLKRLLNGERVELPSYDFETGISNPESGIFKQLEPGDVLLVEGIHALNPLFTGSIGHLNPSVGIFVNADKETRFWRRTIRDSIARGYSPYNTSSQWPNVTEAEHDYIIPTKNNADVVVDTSLSLDEFRAFTLSNTTFKVLIYQAYMHASIENNTTMMDTIISHIDCYYERAGLLELYEKIKDEMPDAARIIHRYLEHL